MGFLPDIFVDESLAARQAQLDGQWSSLNALQQTCDNFPSQAWVEFNNDLRNWREFYGSGSNWSQSSEKATNSWQGKAQEWAARMAASGCRGSVGSVGGDDIPSVGDAGIPGVKDAPPLSAGIIDEALEGFGKVKDSVLAPIETVGWVVTGLIVLVLVGIIVIAVRGNVNVAGLGSVGGS